MVSKVVLTGFSGVGKSSVSKILAKKYLLPVVDTDDLVEQQTGKKIENLIRVDGEKYFREQELKALEVAFSGHARIISLGGGSLLSKKARSLFNSYNSTASTSLVEIYLAASEETIAKRIESANSEADGVSPTRPLLFEDGQLSSVLLRDLLAKRLSEYERASLKLVSDWSSAEDLAELIARDLLENPGLLCNRLTICPFVYQSGDGIVHYMGSGLLNHLPCLIAEKFASSSRVVIFLDNNFYTHWRKEIAKLQQALSQSVDLLLIPSGEKSKSFLEFEKFSNKLLALGITRADLLIAIGGGVVGDLVGLLASTFLRGIALIHVPTTIVSQVDSAIGGKTAINLDGGKNQVGTFYPGKAVLSDSKLLKTLPEREYLSGLAEVVKYGAIGSKEFFDWLTINIQGIKSRDLKVLHSIVEKSTLAKLAIVSQDPKDALGIRAKLNFGHTFAHAIEKKGGYSRYLHGEAVSIGMVIACRLGEFLQITEPGSSKKLEELLLQLGLPISLQEKEEEEVKLYRNFLVDVCKLEKEDLSSFSNSSRADFDEFFRAGKDRETRLFESQFIRSWSDILRSDKKRTSESLNFVFLECLGKSKLKNLEVDYLATLGGILV